MPPIICATTSELVQAQRAKRRRTAARVETVLAAAEREILSFPHPPNNPVSVTRDMSGFRSTRSVRFVPEGSHAAGGQNGPDHRCDWVASSEEVELRGGSGAVGDERAAFPPPARRL